MAFSDSHDSNTRHLPFSTTEDVVSEEGLIELPKSLPGRDHEPHSAYATFPLHRWESQGSGPHQMGDKFSIN